MSDTTVETQRKKTDGNGRSGKKTTSKRRNRKKFDWVLTSEEVLEDYRTACRSREASLLGRREVLTGKAKFGIFGDGKETPQLAMARAFRKGDFRSGYYRDQTFMFATDMSNVREFFAQLYAHADLEADPSSAGRSMNGHFATRTLDEKGEWKNLTERFNCSADVSPTGSQMPRLVGLGYASKLFRELDGLKEWNDVRKFSDNGAEIAFGTIGNASCAEGMFWESVNAIGVLGAPVLLSIWDDDYGISVPNRFQITREDISEVLKGFGREPGEKTGYEIRKVKGWDYKALVETYMELAETVRNEHVPAIVHVVELTQPQGHSTSGSHERYKSPERLEWEKEFDGLRKMREWMLEEGIADAARLDEIEETAKKEVKQWQKEAWEAYISPIRQEIGKMTDVLQEMEKESAQAAEQLEKIRRDLEGIREPFRLDMMVAANRALIAARRDDGAAKRKLIAMKKELDQAGKKRYGSHLHSDSAQAALKISEVAPEYADDSPSINGSEVLNACFDHILERDPRVAAFGEDVGKLGGVNQGFVGLQEKYGPMRVADTGIRETTIIGQAIGMAMRGLRPIAEIQYLDYLLYALQIMSDDLATVQYRTRGGQKAPVIIRTRGHRLEGIWHSGSPMAGIINLVRGMHVLVPRDMTHAAAFYNTLLQSDEPGLVVEVLNGYRLKERLPKNIGEITLPLGVPEVIRSGTDLTVVTYGACCRVAMEAAELLSDIGIDIEIIDVQTLLPFDLQGRIVESLKKTNRILFLDEDVPGGTTAYMMREVLEVQGGYRLLDSAPATLPAQEHRPAYGSDGNYWSKPNVEHVFEAVYEMIHEAAPADYPIFYR